MRNITPISWSTRSLLVAGLLAGISHINWAGSGRAEDQFLNGGSHLRGSRQKYLRSEGANAVAVAIALAS